MRRIIGVIAMMYCLGMVAGYRHAWGDESFDFRRYANIWRGTADWGGRYTKWGSVSMIIIIAGNDDGGYDFSWEINGKTIDLIDSEDLQSTVQDRISGLTAWDQIPLFCLYGRDEKNEHIFCGILYDGFHADDEIHGVYRLRFPCQYKGKPAKCGEELAIDLQAEIDYYAE